jgi:hypothetical protein
MRRRIEHAALRFVDQLLALLRGATLDELAELLATEETLAARAPRNRSRRRRGPLPRRAAGSEPELRSPAEEITDPGALLEAVALVEASAGKAPAFPAAPESAERLMTAAPATSAEAAPRLRAGEAIARANGAGLVIRRRKRASAAEPAAIGTPEHELAPGAPPSSAPTDGDVQRDIRQR